MSQLGGRKGIGLERITYSNPISLKKGGMITKTGMVKLHKGERVLTVKQAKKYK